MKNRALQILVAAALVALAFALRGRPPESGRPRGVDRGREPTDTPEAVVAALYDAAAHGDDEAYLALVSGKLRRSLTRTRDETGREGFRKGLRRSAAGMKGLACTRPERSPAGFTALDVELVFADRNERQRVLLTRRPTSAAAEGDAWLVASMGPAETTKPDIPYGTPVFTPVSEE